MAGVTRTSDVRLTNTGITISDLLDQQPNTARLRTWRGAKPAVGAEIKVGLGGVSSLEQLLFAGHIREVTQIYEGDNPANIAYDLSCIDYTWLLNRRKVIKYYPSQSATAVVLDLIASFTSGFTTTNVVAGLPTIDAMTFTNEDMDDALTRIVRAIGGYWYIDYLKDLHVFLTEATGDPTIITTANPQGAAEILHQLDLSQIRTRVYVEGGGAQAASEIAVGAIVLYVDDGSWYSASGGTVVVGAQRITYTGISTTVISPGTPLPDPGAATLTAAVASGNGNLVGAYKYKFTWHNGTGETLGSTASATVTPVGTPTPGACSAAESNVVGTLAGTYLYKIAYVTALGETLPGTASGGATPDAASVPFGPSLNATASAVGPLFGGAYQYAVTFVNPLGESLKSTAASITPAAQAPPTVGISTLSPTTGGNLDPSATYNYKLTFISAYGESTGSPACVMSTSGTQNAISLVNIQTGPTGTLARSIYRTAGNGAEYRLLYTLNDNTTNSYTDTKADDERSNPIPTVNTFGGSQVTVSSVATGPTGTLARRIYRTKRDGSVFFLIAQLSDNTTTSFSDNVPDTVLMVTAPIENTAGGEQVSLSGIPVAAASAGVLGRRIYRTKAGGSEYFYIDQISDNTTTTYTDNIPDAALTVHAPLVSTAGGQQVSLSSIDVGPTGTTSRRIYRTLAGGNDYLYAGTIHNNTATTYTDNLPDNSLGQPLPTVNNSGGQTVSVTSLTGVPPSGAGSVLYAIPKGESVNILITRNDTAAQTSLAALVGGDGIHEHYIQDNRLGQAECEARGDAELDAFKLPIETVTLTTRDPNARTGKTLELALSAPTSLNGSYKIQTVQISQVGTTTAYPLRQVTASSQRYTLEELLRIRRTA